MNANRRVGFLLALGVLSFIGCGGERSAVVTGTVTIKNQPLASGIVTFFPENGTPVAVFVEAGSYTVPSLLYGNYRISVTPQTESPEVTSSGSGKTMKPGEVDSKGKVVSVPQKTSGQSIPNNYRSVDTSGLSCKVDQPQVMHPIILE